MSDSSDDTEAMSGLTEDDWLESGEVQELLNWLEQCTLAELLHAKQHIEKRREVLNQ